MSWSPTDIRTIATVLADAALLGEWTVDAVSAEMAHAVGEDPTGWIDLLADELVAAYRHRPADRSSELVAYVALLMRADLAAAREQEDENEASAHEEDEEEGDWSDDEWDEWSQEVDLEHEVGPDSEARALPRLFVSDQSPTIATWRVAKPQMGRRRWDVPAIATEADLARFLRLAGDDLAWLADPRSLERSASATAMRNYSYTWVPRRSGEPRLIEAPKPWLKQLQRRLLRHVLDHIPPHDTAHGFRAGHSPITNARRHVGAAVVLRFDLKDFFTRIGIGRIHGIFRTAGYPERVAHLLASLVTNAAPNLIVQSGLGDVAVGDRHDLRRLLCAPHLPQGAPTSPALANLVAYRLDARLAGLASSLDGTYTRYADDITISGGERLARSKDSITRTVLEIIRAEGFRPNLDKTRVATRAGRLMVTGIVVNERPTTLRSNYDRLRAVLHDARLHGAGVANREGATEFRAAMLGQISWVAAVHPERGRKLRAAFDRVDWSESH